VLGGQKFLVHNILFKVPDARVFAEYPDPLWASMKVAGHELKGMQCLASYFLDKVRKIIIFLLCGSCNQIFLAQKVRDDVFFTF
jgi:hypothetical protein